MLLRKRPRAPIMRRTTSMGGMSLTVEADHEELVVCDPQQVLQDGIIKHPQHVIGTAHFLRSCGFCKRALAPGRDIYMYRGDTAFCSLECREKLMKQEERKEKWKVASNKENQRASPPTALSKERTN